MFINQPTLFLAAALASAALAGSAGAASGTVNQFDATKAFRADHPKAMVMTTAGRLHKIADPAIATGHTAKDSAVAAKATVAQCLVLILMPLLRLGHSQMASMNLD
jgi:hypothetical protein